MAQVRLTEKSIKRKAPKHGQPAIELWDSSCQGLCLRISYGGKRTYNVMPRINGRQVRYRLGTTESLSLSEARDMARDVFKNAAKGIDPREADRQAKIEAERSRRNSFRSVFEDYLADYAADLRTKDKIKKTMEREVLPLWGSRPIKGIIHSRAVSPGLIGNTIQTYAKCWALTVLRLIATAAQGVRQLLTIRFLKKWQKWTRGSPAR